MLQVLSEQSLGAEYAHPDDPEDLTQCRQLLEEVPEYRQTLHLLAAQSGEWDEFVQSVQRIVHSRGPWEAREHEGLFAAAPDLLAALNDLLYELPRHSDGLQATRIVAARNAIEKATGKPWGPVIGDRRNDGKPAARVEAIVMPCPFCGASGEDIEVLLDYLDCRVCAAQGPYSSYSDDDDESVEPEKAVELWNRRKA
jgi:hypothetical protein